MIELGSNLLISEQVVGHGHVLVLLVDVDRPLHYLGDGPQHPFEPILLDGVEFAVGLT